MLYSENLKVIEEIKGHIPAGSKIINSKIVENFNSLFVRVDYELSEEYQKKNNLWYRERSLDILLIPSDEYEGGAITSCANVN